MGVSTRLYMHRAGYIAGTHLVSTTHGDVWRRLLTRFSRVATMRAWGKPCKRASVVVSMDELVPPSPLGGGHLPLKRSEFREAGSSQDSCATGTSNGRIAMQVDGRR